MCSGSHELTLNLDNVRLVSQVGLGRGYGGILDKSSAERQR